MASIKIVQGDTASFVLTIKDLDNTVVDLTGGTVKFRIVEDVTDAEGSALYVDNSVTLSDATNGQATVTIAAATTIGYAVGGYHWQVEYIDAAAAVSHSYTDTLVVLKSIYSNG